MNDPFQLVNQAGKRKLQQNRLYPTKILVSFIKDHGKINTKRGQMNYLLSKVTLKAIAYPVLAL